MPTNESDEDLNYSMELWRKGKHIATFDARFDAAEAWVEKLRVRTGARLGWLYFGGRAFLRFLGDDATRTQVFAAIKELEAELDGTIMRTFGPDDPPAQGGIPLSLFK